MNLNASSGRCFARANRQLWFGLINAVRGVSTSTEGEEEHHVLLRLLADFHKTALVRTVRSYLFCSRLSSSVSSVGPQFSYSWDRKEEVATRTDDGGTRGYKYR